MSALSEINDSEDGELARSRSHSARLSYVPLSIAPARRRPDSFYLVALLKLDYALAGIYMYVTLLCRRVHTNLGLHL
jgi:hypothetical protein